MYIVLVVAYSIGHSDIGSSWHYGTEHTRVSRQRHFASSAVSTAPVALAFALCTSTYNDRPPIEYEDKRLYDNNKRVRAYNKCENVIKFACLFGYMLLFAQCICVCLCVFLVYL